MPLGVTSGAKTRRKTLKELVDTLRLMAKLIYVAGLRINECMQLMVLDLDLASNNITIRSGKVKKDQTLPLLCCLATPLRNRLLKVAQIDKTVLLARRGFSRSRHLFYTKASPTIRYFFKLVVMMTFLCTIYRAIFLF